MEKAVFNATLFELWNKRPELEEDDKQEEAETLAKAFTNERLARIQNNPSLVKFVKKVSVENLDCHNIGSIKAERPDNDYSNRESL